MRLLTLLALAIALMSPACADFSYSFDPNPLNSEGMVGLHMGRSIADPFAHGISWDVNGQPAWQTGLDQTLNYSYPGGVIPDLVIAYRAGFKTDSLRMRWDDARLELGFAAGHPVQPFQLAVTAGTPDKPLGGITVGTLGYQYGLYLYNRGPSKRNTISFQNLFGLSTDAASNGTGDFRLFNWQANANVFTVQPNNAFCLSASALGFFGAPPQSRPHVAGSWSDATASKSLLAALVSLGLVTDGTTP